MTLINDKGFTDTCCWGLQTADKENNPRGINRHKFTIPEAEEALQQPVVQALLDLCKFRNTHPAFNGKVCPIPVLKQPSGAAGCILLSMRHPPCLGRPRRTHCITLNHAWH